MKMVLPTDGHRSASAFMAGMQDTQGDAFWLLKAQGHWHGGIHLFERFAPDAVYRPDAPKGQGLKSMTDGHIVAYRLNDDYLAAAYRRQSFLFSSTFILLKSACVPDKAQPENGLDFYTLWMQIAPLSVYGAGDAVTAEVIASALKVRRDNPAWGWVREGLPDGHQARGHTAYDVYNRYAAPQDTHTLLPRHSVVDILAEAAFLLESKAAPFVYARVVAVPEGAASGLSAGECGWISGQGAHLKRRGGLGALPRWMKSAREKGVFNQVVALGNGEAIPVAAGEVIGHLGYLGSPTASRTISAIWKRSARTAGCRLLWPTGPASAPVKRSFIPPRARRAITTLSGKTALWPPPWGTTRCPPWKRVLPDRAKPAGTGRKGKSGFISQGSARGWRPRISAWCTSLTWQSAALCCWSNRTRRGRCGKRRGRAGCGGAFTVWPSWRGKTPATWTP
ncbi:hypothetical protein ABK905_21350 [Acerihabitans sp. KWT182]|uniref:Uncharacterized protein n=1 Tax=Acerihabitans sp. KWT182 TaxID=3157919 RepID=A0AAU7Q7Y0_9GAMM